MVDASPFRLDGRVALVTGAGSERGIGRAVAGVLHAAGARVAVADADAEGARRNAADLGEGALGMAVDVLDEASVAACAAEVRGKLGGVTVLVNAAGITRSRPVWEITLEEYDRVMDVNVRGGLLCMNAVVSDMRAAGWGRLIWISSISGKQGGGIFGSAHYAASKAAVIGLCQAAARELGPFGITSNAIAPGLVLTGIVARASSPEREAEIARRVAETVPARRVGRPEDVAYAALYLASEEAGYVTGEVLDVNGGAYFD
jgi:NAD(P)-dependent dehydrogenase (short-subunit alcohol dehydrogenase family)